MTAIQLYWFTLGISWTIVETLIALKTRVGSTDNAQNPYRSERLIWQVVLVALLAALSVKRLHLIPLPMDVPLRHAAASVLFMLGLALRGFAVSTLKGFFSTSVAIQDQHQLVDSGPYRYVRHPAYSGLLLAFCAAGIAMGDGLALLLLVVPIAYVMVRRIHIEEAWLLAHFGQGYADYCQRTHKLIPLLY